MMFESSLLLYAIGSFLYVVHCQTVENGFALELRELIPCHEAELGALNVSLHKSAILAVQADLTLCNNTSWNINQFNVSCTGMIVCLYAQISTIYQCWTIYPTSKG